jgi:hypothetical protein
VFLAATLTAEPDTEAVTGEEEFVLKALANVVAKVVVVLLEP